MTRDEWYAHLPKATQEEKDSALFFASENLAYEQVTALIKAGAKANGGYDMFAWTLRRTTDAGMAGAMLDGGWTCERVKFEDCWAFYDDDNKAMAYKTLGRMLDAGMPGEERYKLAAAVLKRGDFEYLDAHILRPGEDVTKLLKYPATGQLDVAASAADRRPIDHTDVEKYVAWRNSIASLYETTFAGGVNEAKLKETVSSDGMTGLMLALRAGKIGAVADYYKAEPGKSFDAADLLKQDNYGQSAVSLLGQRMELQRLFEPQFWKTAPENALELLDSLPALYKNQVDPAAVAKNAAETRKALRAAVAKSFAP